ncbi:hypothetical protein PsAD2_03347 [Pseudovibrio axinellae]|uniref:Uncharacterized protein n=1 Tax=Pseudovibrio axinellae TaxID=989403 RepID=A0A165WNE3_9HYPH|nr:hypothetical protein [Pseudovibrio axinellae]KZL16730.1 hypothetical protein PsAD2_03347 [Pseudovibrio axinellae]SEQ76996.1 hypothetical protein SAMN05421798_104163 [Pseudovibrio axinellae]
MEQVVLVPERQVFEPHEDWAVDSSGTDMQADLPLEEEAEPQMPLPSGLLPDDEPATHGKSGHGAFGFMDRLMGSDKDEASGAKGLSKDNVDRLQSTLFEQLKLSVVP